MTNDFANHPAHQPMHAAHAYTGFLSILQSLCSLPFLALRAVVDFFAPPSAFELSQRPRSASRVQAPAPALAPTATPSTNSNPADSTASTHSPHTGNTMQKIANNDRPTVTSAKKTLKTGLTMQHGRIIISGRMADVCAELERLAALEAASA